MKKLAIILGMALSLLCAPALADPYSQEGGQPQGLLTNTKANIAAADTAVSLTAPSGHLRIQLSAASAVVNVNLNNGTATTSNYEIPSGGTFEYWGRPLTGFHYIGASATGTISVAAW